MPTINNPVNNFTRMQQVNATKAPVAFRESQELPQSAPEEKNGMKTSTKVIIGATLLALGTLVAYLKSPAFASKINNAATAVVTKTREYAGKAKGVFTETVIPKAKKAGSVVADKVKNVWNATASFIKGIPAKFKSTPPSA